MWRAFAVNRNDRQTPGGIDFEHGKVGQAVRTHQQCFKHAAILQGNDDLVGIVDHMFVGNNVAALVHNHPGAQRADLKLVMGRAIEAAVINVNHGRGGTANGRVIGCWRFIRAVELGSGQFIELTQRRHRQQQQASDNQTDNNGT